MSQQWQLWGTSSDGSENNTQHQWSRHATVGKLHVANIFETRKWLRIIFDVQYCHACKIVTGNDWNKPGIVIWRRKIPMLQNVMSRLTQVLTRCGDEIQHNIDKQSLYRDFAFLYTRITLCVRISVTNKFLKNLALQF